MQLNILCSFFIIFHFVKFSLAGDGLNVRYRISSFKNCVPSKNLLMQSINVSLQQCVNECALRKGCRTVKYFRYFRTCELLSVYSGDALQNEGKNSACVFVKKTDMDLSELQGACLCSERESCDPLNLDSRLSCKVQECQPFTIENGKVRGNMLSLGAVVTFECDPMYSEVKGETRSVCLPNGTWSYYPECSAGIAGCDEIILENGHVTILGFISTFICDPSYVEINGISEAKCQENGTWSYIPQCKRDCHEPLQEIENAKLIDGNTYDGQNRTYVCNQGFIFPTGYDSMTITCNADGHWSVLRCATETDGNHTCNGCILLRDCQDIQELFVGVSTEVYQIFPVDNYGFKVRCDMDTPPGGWTVIQRRVSGSNFKLNWETYKEGFGNFNDNFWLGNDNIWTLTNNGSYMLRVDLKDENGEEAYAEYNSFFIGDEWSKYKLHVSGPSGTAGDSLIKRHDGMMFSTFDQDNDIYYYNCADTFGGGWWYSDCHSANLNGPYGDQDSNKGMTWRPWRNNSMFMRFTEMKIRRSH